MSEKFIVEPEIFDGEDVLPDDYPIYGDYLYVADGHVVRSDWHGITARELRVRLNAKEIRRCNFIGRRVKASETIPPMPMITAPRR